MATNVPDNILRNVQTYQKAQLAIMLNEFVALNIANKKFLNFQEFEGQLGDTVTYDLAPRATTRGGLIISPRASTQRVESLTCCQAVNTSIAFTMQQLLFNVDDYMERFGEANCIELGGSIEEDVLRTIDGSMRVNDPENENFGQLINPRSGPYRFYGDGTMNINTFQQLAQACANFRDYGSAKFDYKAIIPLNAEPEICGSGQNMFTLNRNNETAESWEIGDFAKFRWTRSNLLPRHVAGTVGQSTTGSDNILTLVSTNDPTGTNITELTFSGAPASDSNAIKQGDFFQFIDGVSGQENLRFRTFTVHAVSSQPVQNQAIEDAESDGSGNVTIKLKFPLTSVPNQNQNLNVPLQPGMKIKVMNSYRAGVLMSGNPLYLSMPRMQDMDPYSSVSTMDKNSGISMRNYWGNVFGQNQKNFVWDQIYGANFVGENGLCLLFPDR